MLPLGPPAGAPSFVSRLSFFFAFFFFFLSLCATSLVLVLSSLLFLRFTLFSRIFGINFGILMCRYIAEEDPQVADVHQAWNISSNGLAI